MEKIIIVLLIVIGIIAIVRLFFTHKTIERYVREKGGKLISTEEFRDNGYSDSNRSVTVVAKYYDKHGNLCSLDYHKNGLFGFFGDDDIIEYAEASPEHEAVLRKEAEAGKRALEFQGKVYHVKEGELSVKQEFSYPNVGELVFLNNKPAPNGKYKIGFMNFIIVENGKVKDLAMT